MSSMETAAERSLPEEAFFEEESGAAAEPAGADEPGGELTDWGESIFADFGEDGQDAEQPETAAEERSGETQPAAGVPEETEAEAASASPLPGGMNAAPAPGVFGKNGVLHRVAESALAQERGRLRDAEYRRFVEEHPDMRDFEKEIPAEVWDRVRAGESLTAAYRGYELDRARMEIAALRKQSENRAAATGSAQNDADGAAVDEFLEGFLWR